MVAILVKYLGFLRDDERAATAIEYALIATLIAIAAMAAFAALGDSVISLWSYVSTNVTGAMPSSP